MPDPSATLQAIKDRAGVVAKLGPPRPGGELINAAHRSAADVPRLVAALEAALKLAEDWDRESDQRHERSTSADTDGEVAPILEGESIAYSDCAQELLEAITDKLTGQGDGSA